MKTFEDTASASKSVWHYITWFTVKVGSERPVSRGLGEGLTTTSMMGTRTRCSTFAHFAHFDVLIGGRGRTRNDNMNYRTSRYAFTVARSARFTVRRTVMV